MRELERYVYKLTSVVFGGSVVFDDPNFPATLVPFLQFIFSVVVRYGVGSNVSSEIIVIVQIR